MRESMSSCHIVLCMSSISFNLSAHPIFLLITSLRPPHTLDAMVTLQV